MSDCVAANIASYRDSLKGPFPYSEHNGCLPHTGAHVGEAMETPHVDEFMGHYNAIVGTSNYAVVHFSEITGYTPPRRRARRAGSRQTTCRSCRCYPTPRTATCSSGRTR